VVYGLYETTFAKAVDPSTGTVIAPFVLNQASCNDFPPIA